MKKNCIIIVFFLIKSIQFPREYNSKQEHSFYGAPHLCFAEGPRWP